MNIFELVVTCILFVSLGIASIAYAINSADNDSGWGILGGVLGVILFISAIPVSIQYFGFYPNYQQAEVEGYLIAFGKSGYIWRTNEGEIQMGTGNQTAVQNHFLFSTPDDALANQIAKDLGKHVRVHVISWKIVPWAIGETDDIVDSVEVIP